jgi:hypothetical protein
MLETGHAPGQAKGRVGRFLALVLLGVLGMSGAGAVACMGARWGHHFVAWHTLTRATAAIPHSNALAATATALHRMLHPHPRHSCNPTR